MQGNPLIKESIQAITDKITQFQNSLAFELDAKFEITEGSVAEVFAEVGGTGALLAAVEQTVTGLATTAGIAFSELNALVIKEHSSTRSAIDAAEKKISKQVSEELAPIFLEVRGLYSHMDVKIREAQETILQRFEKDKAELLKAIEQESKIFVEKTALEVSQLVVGESYYKWDSTSSYFPTVVFVFNEVTQAETPRRSQIKARLKKTSEELTQKDIEMLRERIQQHTNWKYRYGTVRANFVSGDKRWKSTVFIAEQKEALSVFQTVGKILNEKINPDLISYTTIKEKRPRITTRQSPLAGKGLNPTNYNSVFTVQLRKATLLVNNTEKPYLLYP